MHCPRCGHQQNSDEIRFCAKCGLEISGVKELLAPELRQTKAERKREINKAQRQGFSMILFGLVVILILAILRDFFTVPKALFAASVLIFMVGGMIRMVSPFIFGGSNQKESKGDSLENNELETRRLSGNNLSDKSLSEAEFRPPVNFGEQIYDTNELVSPLSITENTTRNLKKEA